MCARSCFPMRLIAQLFLWLGPLWGTTWTSELQCTEQNSPPFPAPSPMSHPEIREIIWSFQQLAVGQVTFLPWGRIVRKCLQQEITIPAVWFLDEDIVHFKSSMSDAPFKLKWLRSNHPSILISWRQGTPKVQGMAGVWDKVIHLLSAGFFLSVWVSKK